MTQRRIEASIEIDAKHLLHMEQFSSLLVPLVWNRMEHSTRCGFEAMNQALKTRAEAQAGKE